MIVQKRAKQIVARHKTQPPHQNRLGLSVGAAGRAPEDDTQVTTNSLSCIISLPLRVQYFFCVDSLCILTAGKAQSYIATMAMNSGNQSSDTFAIKVVSWLCHLGQDTQELIMQHVQSCNSVPLVFCHSATVVSINIRIVCRAVQVNFALGELSFSSLPKTE